MRPLPFLPLSAMEVMAQSPVAAGGRVKIWVLLLFVVVVVLNGRTLNEIGRLA